MKRGRKPRQVENSMEEEPIAGYPIDDDEMPLFDSDEEYE